VAEKPRSRTTATATVLFCDIVDSTARLSRLGDIRGDEFRHDFTERLARCIEDSGGKMVKHLGDGVMAVFERSTIAALECAQKMHRRFEDFAKDDPVRLRIGISAGEIAVEDGDWFGIPVVEAARLCARADPGHTLAPSLVENLVGSRAAEHRFLQVGPMELKGLPAPVPVVDVVDVDQLVLPETVSAGGQDATSRSVKRRWVTVGVALGLVGALALGALAAFGGGTSEIESAQPGQSERQLASSDDPGAGTDGMENAQSPVGYEPELVDVACDEHVVEVDARTVCKELRVPESRDDPDGPTIAVSVVGIENEESEAPSVLLLDVNDPITRTPLVRAADVWQLIPRGFETDGSASRLCPGLGAAWAETLALPSDSQDVISARSAAAGECARLLEDRGWNRAGYNLAEVWADLRDLALALGEDRYAVASGGYFTPAATTFAVTMRDLVGSVLLLNPTPPGDSMFSVAAASLAVHTDALAELCAQDEQCGPTFADLSSTFEARSAQLATQSEMISTTSLDGQGPFDVLLDDRRLAKALKTAFQSTKQVALVPAAVLGASQQLTAAAGITEDVGFFIGPKAIGPAMLSSLCSYDAQNIMLSEIVDAGLPEYAGASDAWIPQVCASWDVPNVFEQLDHPFVVDIPVLIAQGGLSIAGAQGWGERMGALLGNSTVLRFPTISEDLALATPECLGKLRVAFVEDPSVVNGYDVEACEAESPAVAFTPAPG
jgi:class 3 adenylate cyclase/pimeloyl-ACP methyl ester carboxylesterase